MVADEFAVFPRGATAVKGKGFMKTFTAVSLLTTYWSESTQSSRLF